MPILLLLYPHETPYLLASISLAVVFFNALAASVAYAQMGRIDYRSGALFALATLPGAILGALTTAYLPRRLFDVVLGILLIAGAVALLCGRSQNAQESPSTLSTVARILVEADGTRHLYAYDPLIGAGLSLSIFLSAATNCSRS
jgi:uncharacterized membrane protein YfcA